MRLFLLELEPFTPARTYNQGDVTNSIGSSIGSKFCLIAALCGLARADCIPIEQAGKHIGETQCVSGRVVRVKAGDRGVHYLDFCDDFRTCPFSVVVFPRDLKSVGDVRQLQGKVVEIRGPVKAYDGRAEIILQESRQLGGAGVKLPSFPKAYDVEQSGRYSAGSPGRPSTARKSSRKRVPATLPANISDAEAASPDD